MTANDSFAPSVSAMSTRHPMRARPRLLARAAMLAVGLPLVARAGSAGAQSEGFHFTTEAAHATLSHVDPLTGIVTDVTIYAADDQGYKDKGTSGGPVRVSKVFATVEQYDPSCVGGGKLNAAGGGGDGGGGGSDCLYRSFEGAFPGKDGGSLPEDAFIVSTPGLDGAWLNVVLTLVTFGENGEPKQTEAAISIAWSAIGEMQTIHANDLYHPDKIAGLPRGTETVHNNTRQRQAAAVGSVAFDGVTYDLVSSFAVIQDAKFRVT